MSEDMSPYCSAHDEWLCMYARYHDANNVSNFGGDPVTQILKRLKNLIFHFAFQNMRSAGKMIGKMNLCNDLLMVYEMANTPSFGLGDTDKEPK